jgi:hypothetical protein
VDNHDAASKFGFTGTTLTQSGLAFTSPGPGQPVYLSMSPIPVGLQAITPVDTLTSVGQASSMQLSSEAGEVAAVGSPNKKCAQPPPCLLSLGVDAPTKPMIHQPGSSAAGQSPGP